MASGLSTRVPRALPKREASAVGLVLSGGGSRGIAHIGVIRALLQHGVDPEWIAGSSAGAMVGALFAQGLSPGEILEFFCVTNPYRLTNVAIGKPGIWDSHKYVPAMRRYLPHDSFEGLKRKLRIVATDLLSGEPRVFESGPLVLPVLASASVPMVFSPVEIEGRLYVDGGIVDNFPIQLIADRCRATIGVHVNPLGEVKASELGTSLAVLGRALDVGMFNKSRAAFECCDVVVRPPGLARFGMFETKRFSEIEAAGYEEAVRCMPEILRAVGGKGLRPLVRRKRDAVAQMNPSGV